MRKLVMGLAIFGLVVGQRVTARSDPTPRGGFCEVTPGLCGGIEDTSDASPPEHAIPRRELSRFFWRRVQLTGVAECRGADGRQVAMLLIDRVTNEAVHTRVSCPDPTVHDLPPIPPVPLPPSAVWDQVSLPAPQVRVNPGAGGLTGLETFFWYDQPATASLSLNLGGFIVTLDARAIGFRWRTGDGTEVTSAVPGTATQPAARHVYERKGKYTIDVEVTWSGTYTFAGPGFDPISVPLGERTFSGRAAYSVAEIRGVRQ